jgi:hypothetical protein
MSGDVSVVHLSDNIHCSNREDNMVFSGSLTHTASLDNKLTESIIQ